MAPGPNLRRAAAAAAPGECAPGARTTSSAGRATLGRQAYVGGGTGDYFEQQEASQQSGSTWGAHKGNHGGALTHLHMYRVRREHYNVLEWHAR